MSDPGATVADAVEQLNADVGAVESAPEPTPGAVNFPDADPDLPDVDEPAGFDVWSWLFSTPEGSIRSVDLGEWWDPDQGGTNRLALLGADLAGEHGDPPVWWHLLVAPLELYAANVDLEATSADDQDDVEGADPEDVAHAIPERFR